MRSKTLLLFLYFSPSLLQRENFSLTHKIQNRAYHISNVQRIYSYWNELTNLLVIYGNTQNFLRHQRLWKVEVFPSWAFHENIRLKCPQRYRVQVVPILDTYDLYEQWQDQSLNMVSDNEPEGKYVLYKNKWVMSDEG